MKGRNQPSRSQIDALLRFLPAFKRQGFWFERVVWEGGQISYVEKSPEAEMFLRALRDNAWVLPKTDSDWRRDPDRVETSVRIGRADVETLRRLLTSWLEKDRLLPGHLGALFERGDLTRALERLQRIAAPDPDAGRRGPELRPDPRRRAR